MIWMGLGKHILFFRSIAHNHTIENIYVLLLCALTGLWLLIPMRHVYITCMRSIPYVQRNRGNLAMDHLSISKPRSHLCQEFLGAIISACEKSSRWEVCMHILNAMEHEHGVTPVAWSYLSDVGLGKPKMETMRKISVKCPRM